MKVTYSIVSNWTRRNECFYKKFSDNIETLDLAIAALQNMKEATMETSPKLAEAWLAHEWTIVVDVEGLTD